jgi:hypothetical protein
MPFLLFYSQYTGFLTILTYGAADSAALSTGAELAKILLAKAVVGRETVIDSAEHGLISQKIYSSIAEVEAACIRFYKC